MMNYHYHLFTIHSSLMLNISIPFLVTSPIFLLPETLVSLSHRLEQCFTDHIVPGKSLKPKVRTGATAIGCWSTRIYNNFSKCPKSHLAKNSLWIASHVWLPVTSCNISKGFSGVVFHGKFLQLPVAPRISRPQWDGMRKPRHTSALEWNARIGMYSYGPSNRCK